MIQRSCWILFSCEYRKALFKSCPSLLSKEGTRQSGGPQWFLSPWHTITVWTQSWQLRKEGSKNKCVHDSLTHLPFNFLACVFSSRVQP